MLYLNSIDITEEIDPTKSNKIVSTIGFLNMDPNFKILCTMVAMIWQN